MVLCGYHGMLFHISGQRLRYDSSVLFWSVVCAAEEGVCVESVNAKLEQRNMKDTFSVL